MPSAALNPAPRVILDHAQRVNFASAQNAVPVIRRVTLENPTDHALAELVLRVKSHPAFCREETWRIDRIDAGETLVLPARAPSFDHAVLAGLNEAEQGQLTVTLEQAGETLFATTLPIELLARDTWGGLGEMAAVLAAFVAPNHPAIARLNREAALILEANQHRPDLDGYQSGDPKRAYLLAAATWSAVTGLGLSYAVPPASFERSGQKVRDPGRIAGDLLATCLDTSLLFAAALEAAGLNPIVVFTQGHAFTGVWLVDKTLPNTVEPDVIELRKAIAAHELVVFETTLATGRPAAGFEAAITAGRDRLREVREAEFQCAIDIRRARAASIKPLASHVATGTPEDDATPAPATPAPLAPPPDFGLLPGELGEEPEPTDAAGRIQRWQRKLLDLSARNRLLNFSNSKQTLPLVCPDVPRLEDLLAAGTALRIISLNDENPLGDRDPELIRQQTGHDVHTAFATTALDHKQVCVPLPGAEVITRLTNLYRKARSDLAEGGTNTLFLAAGFLKWKKDPADKRVFRAPLLLLPVTLRRRSARSDYQLAGHEDEARVNATLLQFLKRDFDLDVAGLDGELPKDDSGIDLHRIFEIVRTAVRDVPGFEVVEESALATFSFSKYLMWKDLVDRIDQLRQNRLVRHLVDSPEEPFAGVDETLPAPEDLDRRFGPAELLTPLPADSSQLSAVIAAAEGRDFVIIGPPGTGKSQTIANMIAHCLAHGKSVLFVAEKSAALDVVHRRLKAHGLGDVCLELHSNKADRKRVLAQLGAAWDRSAAANESEWIRLTDDLRVHRDQLNAYADALHAPGRHGFSIFAAIGIVVDRESPLQLDYAGADIHDANDLRAILKAAETAGRTHAHVRDLTDFDSIGCAEWSMVWQRDLVNHAQALLGVTADVRRHHAGASRALGLTPDEAIDLARLKRLAAFAIALRDSAAGDFGATLHPDFDRFGPALAELREAQADVAASQAQLSGDYPPEKIPLIPLAELEREWTAAVGKIWPLSPLGKRSVRKKLAQHTRDGQADPEQDLGLLRLIRANLACAEASPWAVLPGFAGLQTDTDNLASWLEHATALRQSIQRLQGYVADQERFDATVSELLALHTDEHELFPELISVATTRAALKSARTIYETHIEGELVAEDVATIESTLNATISRKGRLADWTRWNAARRDADACGLAPLIAALESGAVADDDAVEQTRVAYFAWWLPLAIDASPALRAFIHWDHTDCIARFRELDETVQNLVSAQVRLRLTHGLPPRDAVPRRSELGTLRHQLGLQRPSLAIRQLIAEMPTTFNQLTPCVLMSPLSVAQYLPAGHTQFDLVIFDEASQITTWDAVGAIARGRQSIIVGDPKQLPPTNFFGRSEEDDEELALYEKDLPSILEEAVTTGLPTHQLNWHYRSRDEALIAFSNFHYYDGRLVTFPCPQTDSDALRHHAIDGLYARGTGRTNDAEARAIVEFACIRMKAWLDQPEAERLTLGVITFNVQQQELILDQFDAARRADPELEWFFDEEREEPLIVKNLENIQGDERDVMLFSVTFGPDADGAITMNFGAINNDGGEKRLNVAVTRARAELHVFASLRAEQVDLNRTAALGVAHLKAFLDYAERGNDALRTAGGAHRDAGAFEATVATALGQLGWTVRPNIGVSQFRIDLGVVHPDRPDAYLAGIECDGDTYQRSASARDRDKIREAVLTGLGWHILRVWSTDWYMNPEEASRRLDEALRASLDEDRANRPAEPEAPAPALPEEDSDPST